MKKVIACVFIYILNSSLSVFAVGLELTDVIKQAREIQLQKELAVKNTVKEIKEKSENNNANSSENTANTANATETHIVEK